MSMERSEEQAPFEEKMDKDHVKGNEDCCQFRDRNFRRKFYFTMCLCFGSIAYGWTHSQIGPSLLDLMLITKADITEGSALFTALSVGKLIGVILGGMLIDKCNEIPVITTCLLGIAVTSFIKPWCYLYWMMVSISAIQGFSMGIWLLGANSLCAQTWGKEKRGRPFMQALHFSFSFGGVLSPFATKPFLSTRDCVNTSTETSRSCFPDPLNVSSTNITNITLVDSVNSTYMRNDSGIGGSYATQDARDSDVYIALMISGIMTSLTVLPLVVEGIRSRKSKSTSQPTVKELTSSQKALAASWRIIVFYLLGQMLFSYNGTEFTFSSLLALFCVEKLGWGKGQSSDITSLYYGAFSAARFVGIILSNFLSPSWLIPSLLSGMIASFVTLYLGITLQKDSLVWVSVTLIGISMSSMSPTTFTWIQEDVQRMTGRLTAFLVISGNTACIILPVLIGYLTETRDPIWFIYVLGASVLVCLVTYMCLRIVVRYKIKK